eukprot:scaffold1495_cov248-Pinguiococcus_pyrenoidosus.AAC.5
MVQLVVVKLAGLERQRLRRREQADVLDDITASAFGSVPLPSDHHGLLTERPRAASLLRFRQVLPDVGGVVLQAEGQDMNPRIEDRYSPARRMDGLEAHATLHRIMVLLAALVGGRDRAHRVSIREINRGKEALPNGAINCRHRPGWTEKEAIGVNGHVHQGRVRARLVGAEDAVQLGVGLLGRSLGVASVLHICCRGILAPAVQRIAALLLRGPVGVPRRREPQCGEEHVARPGVVRAVREHARAGGARIVVVRGARLRHLGHEQRLKRVPRERIGKLNGHASLPRTVVHGLEESLGTREGAQREVRALLHHPQPVLLVHLHPEAIFRIPEEVPPELFEHRESHRGALQGIRLDEVLDASAARPMRAGPRLLDVHWRRVDEAVGRVQVVRAEPLAVQLEEELRGRPQSPKALRQCLVPWLPAHEASVGVLLIPPGVESCVVDRQLALLERFLQGAEQVLVVHAPLGVIVVEGALVGPVAEPSDGRVVVLRGRGHAGLALHDVAPSLQRVVDASRRVHEHVRDRGDRPLRQVIHVHRAHHPALDGHEVLPILAASGVSPRVLPPRDAA